MLAPSWACVCARVIDNVDGETSTDEGPLVRSIPNVERSTFHAIRLDGILFEYPHTRVPHAVDFRPTALALYMRSIIPYYCMSVQKCVFVCAPSSIHTYDVVYPNVRLADFG